MTIEQVITIRVQKLKDMMAQPDFDKDMTYGYDKAIEELQNALNDFKLNRDVDN